MHNFCMNFLLFWLLWCPAVFKAMHFLQFSHHLSSPRHPTETHVGSSHKGCRRGDEEVWRGGVHLRVQIRWRACTGVCVCVHVCGGVTVQVFICLVFGTKHMPAEFSMHTPFACILIMRYYFLVTVVSLYCVFTCVVLVLCVSLLWR